MSFPTQNQFMVQDANRLYDIIYRILRAKGRMSNLIEKGEVPQGMGYNYQTVIYQRSNPVGGTGWTDIANENGTGNNCITAPAKISPAIDEISWNVQLRTIKSEWICFEDLRRAYNAREQLDAQHQNFANAITDIWEDRDNLAFFTNAGHKIVANSSLTENTNAPDMPLSVPTTRAVEGIFDELYERICVDAGGEEPYAMANGSPVIPAIMSMQQHRNIIKEDASTRQDYQYAEMGKGDQATLLKSWGSDKVYAGFNHIVNLRQPRYDWIGGAWVQRPYYSDSAATLGTASNVNPAYTNAAYEDVYLFHKQVVRRNMPNPGSSYGAGTSFNPVKWNGAVTWINQVNLDENSEAYNPVGNRGLYFASLQAGYQPIKIRYGYVVRVQRCAKWVASACY